MIYRPPQNEAPRPGNSSAQDSSAAEPAPRPSLASHGLASPVAIRTLADWSTLDKAISTALFKRDAETLARTIEELESDPSPWACYYRALALFLAARQAGSDADQTQRMARQAVAALDGMICALEPMEVERLVLSGSICGLLAKHSKGLERGRIGWRAMSEFGQALKLAPENPRAVFAEASASYSMAKPRSREQEGALERLIACERLFEIAARSAQAPVWGHEQLLMYLAEVHLARREVVLAQQAVHRLQRLCFGRQLPAIQDLYLRVAAA